MSSSATVRPVSIERYLSDPLYERYEYIDGQPVELNVGSGSHASVQANCCGLLYAHLRNVGEGRVATELRCRLRVKGQTRFYLPDVSVVLGEASLLEQKYLDRAPDLVVEIRSPDDSFPRLLRKMEEYLASGSQLGWLILPDERCVLICTANQPTRTAAAGEALDGGTLLPGLQFPVDELFS